MPRKSARVPICGKQLFALRQGKFDQADLGVGVRSIQDYEAGRTSFCLVDTRKLIAEKLAVDPVQLGPQGEVCEEYLRVNRCDMKCPGRRVPEATSQDKKDQKNLILDVEVRQRLVQGNPPSLLEAVSVSPYDTLFEWEKTGKHCLGVSAVVYVKVPGRRSPRLLWYQRRVRDGEPGDKDLLGPSVLFHTSFHFGIDSMSGPMDAWIDLAARRPNDAKKKFMRIPDGTLFRVLNGYKFNFTGVRGTCEPLCVVTRIGRKTDTQYVFRVNLQLSGTGSLEKLKERVTRFGLGKHRRESVSFADEEFDPVDFLTFGKKPKCMDYVVLLGREDPDRCKETRFTSGFDLV